MGPEFIYWLQDVREHLRVRRRRQALRRPGSGIDYKRDTDTVRRVVSRIHPRRMRLKVIEVVRETASTKTLRLERTDGELPPFRPGQYINLFVDADGVLTSRPYTISSTPGSGVLDLTVRDKTGGFVAPFLLNEIQVGDELESTGPAGHFYHEPLIDGDDLVFLAGGSGITPFMSIIREAVQHHRPLKMHLLYGSREPEDVIYGKELEELANCHTNLRYSLVISEPPPGYVGLTGMLDADLIRHQIGEVAGKTFYVCGPTVMYDFCAAALGDLGVSRHKIRRELYGPPADVTQEPGWPEGLGRDELFTVEIEGRSAIRAPAGEPLLNTLERCGVVIPTVCRSGACSACRIRLIAGRVYMPAHTGLRESDRAFGYIHSCVAYPVQDIKIGL